MCVVCVCVRCVSQIKGELHMAVHLNVFISYAVCLYVNLFHWLCVCVCVCVCDVCTLNKDVDEFYFE